MIEFIKHILGICGDHWHPNIWTVLARFTSNHLQFTILNVNVEVYFFTKKIVKIIWIIQNNLVY